MKKYFFKSILNSKSIIIFYHEKSHMVQQTDANSAVLSYGRKYPAMDLILRLQVAYNVGKTPLVGIGAIVDGVGVMIFRPKLDFCNHILWQKRGVCDMPNLFF